LDFPYDAHVHTNVSDGRNSLEECVREAEAVGLELMVVTDHYWPEDGDMRERVRPIIQADAGSPVRVVPGAECQIMDARGTLPLDEDEAALVQFVLADFGGRTKGIGLDPPARTDRFIANVFQALLAVTANPRVDALAHPFNLGRFPATVTPGQLPRSGLREVAAACFERDVAFEIMNQMCFWYPDLKVDQFTREYVDLLALFAEGNVKFVLGSDAHSAGAVGNVRWSLRAMAMAGIEKSQVVDLPRKFSGKR